MSPCLCADKPGAPCAVRVIEQHKDHIGIAWDAPDTDGGSPITAYTVEKRDASRTMWTGVGSVAASEKLRFKAGKLFQGSEYLFRVAAENAVGQSEFTQLDHAVVAKLPFGK